MEKVRCHVDGRRRAHQACRENMAVPSHLPITCSQPCSLHCSAAFPLLVSSTGHGNSSGQQVCLLACLWKELLGSRVPSPVCCWSCDHSLDYSPAQLGDAAVTQSCFYRGRWLNPGSPFIEKSWLCVAHFCGQMKIFCT